MAALQVYARSTGTTGTSEKSVVRVIAPANQKLYVYVKIAYKSSSTSAAHIVTKLVRGMSGGTEGAVPLSKRSSADDETPQAQVKAMTGTVPTGGTEIDCHAVEPRSFYQFRGLQLNGGEKLDVLVTSAADIAYEVNIDITE